MNTMAHIYNTHVQNEIADILVYFDENLIIDSVNLAIAQRFNFDTCIPGINLVESLEQKFKFSLENTDTDVRDFILEKRNNVYSLIINLICNSFNLTFTNNYNSSDNYALAYYLYDFLISDFKNKMIMFFTNYIYKEKNNIYTNHLSHLKKEKNSSMVYGKKLYKNTKFATINANMEYVISNLSCYDISFEEILTNVYPEKSIVQLLADNIIPNVDFYKVHYCNLFNTMIKYPIINQVRLLFHSYLMSEQ